MKKIKNFVFTLKEKRFLVTYKEIRFDLYVGAMVIASKKFLEEDAQDPKVRDSVRKWACNEVMKFLNEYTSHQMIVNEEHRAGVKFLFHDLTRDRKTGLNKRVRRKGVIGKPLTSGTDKYRKSTTK